MKIIEKLVEELLINQAMVLNPVFRIKSHNSKPSKDFKRIVEIIESLPTPKLKMKGKR